ncbi:metal tolerance protein 11-like isoform X3 [Olea europaea var. sylvestris]|uniref:metal tolerance protein 11-like isoform X3 n=1 Tax=Olea europaea var. sylvestris TaxID=158386 RepID=UPI000C1CF11B|nr:metal tolerance protein 11-like isoform X3 [Olea europaea var. sylvestris]
MGPEDNVAEYYQQQVEMLEGFNEMDVLAERGSVAIVSKRDREKLVRSETIANIMSNVASMLLFAAKVYASISSGSLAIVASTLDSLLDLLSGFILWFTAFSMQTPNPYRYPIGKKRMQPLDDEFNLTKEQEQWIIGIMLSVTLCLDGPCWSYWLYGSLFAIQLG